MSPLLQGWRESTTKLSQWLPSTGPQQLPGLGPGGGCAQQQEQDDWAFPQDPAVMLALPLLQDGHLPECPLSLTQTQEPNYAPS